MNKRAVRSNQVLQNWMTMVLAFLGFITTVTTFLINLAQWARDAEALRYVSAAGYLLFALCAIWTAFRARGVRRVVEKISLLVLALVTGLYFLWVGTWIETGPKPRLMDDMSAVSWWRPYLSPDGSTVKTSLDTGLHGSALRADFTVKEYGYAAISRDINSNVLEGTQAIRFNYKSTGAPNTIELKLIRQKDAEGQEAVYSVMWNHMTGVKDWTSLEAPFTMFTCWPDTGCALGEPLDVSKVIRIDIAISNKEPDETGSGTIWIDEIVAIP